MTSLAASLLAAVGGARNVRSLSHCWARLRFVVGDRAAVEHSTVTALPGVAIAVDQQGQYQVALRAGLLETYDELITLITEHQEDHHG